MTIAATALTATPGHLLAGTWELRRAEIVQPDGSRTFDPLYGADARGLLLVDETGNYSLQIYRRDRPRFATNDKSTGTAEEYKSTVLGASVHGGRVLADPAAGRLVFQIEFSVYPNWEHTEQVRTFELKDDELTYTVPARPGGGRPVSVWHRMIR